jgi:hypothetical protein
LPASDRFGVGDARTVAADLGRKVEDGLASRFDHFDFSSLRHVRGRSGLAYKILLLVRVRVDIKHGDFGLQNRGFVARATKAAPVRVTLRPCQAPT